MMMVSTSPAFVWRTSSSSVIFAVFSWRRVWPFARSVRWVVARSFAGVTVRAMSDPSCSFETDEDVFDFRVELQRVHAELASDAAAFVTAKWRFLLDAPAAVDAQHARSDAPGNPQRATDVTSPDRADQAVGRVVDQPQDLVLVGERDDGENRSKDLFLGDAHPVVRVIEHGRIQEAAPRQRAAGRRSTGQQPRAFLPADLDVALDPFALLHRDQGPNLSAGVERIANLQLLAAGRDALIELLGDRAMNECAAAGAAVLPGITKDAVDRGRRSLLEIRVRKHDVRGFSSELQGYPRDVRSRLLEDADPGQGLAGKGDLVDTGMSGERAAGAAARAGDDVEHPFGKSGLEGQASQLQRGQRRVARRLEDGGVARGQRRGDLPRGDC